MDPYYLLAMIKVAVIFIVIPLVAISLLFSILKKRSSKKIAITASGLLLLFLVYLIVTDIYPQQAFFEKNFTDNTNLIITDSAKLVFVAGNQSIWDLGGYSISYSYEVPIEDSKKLYEKFLKEGFIQSESWLETETLEELLSKYPSGKVSKILTKEFGFKRFDIMYLNDNRTIIFNSNKW